MDFVHIEDSTVPASRPPSSPRIFWAEETLIRTYGNIWVISCGLHKSLKDLEEIDGDLTVPRRK